MLPLAAAILALAPQAAYAKTVVVKYDNDKGSVTLRAGDTLLVRLYENRTTGYSWHPVLDLGFPMLLTGRRVIREVPRSAMSHGRRIHAYGAGETVEFRYFVSKKASISTSATWLRMLYLRPWIREVATSRLWAIQVIGK